MQAYILYQEPMKTAKALNKAELEAQVKAYQRAINTADISMREWLDRCALCFVFYLRGQEDLAIWWSQHANLVRPDYITDAYCEERRKEYLEKQNKKKNGNNRNTSASKKEVASE